jgi:hypothetical protein
MGPACRYPQGLVDHVALHCREDLELPRIPPAPVPARPATAAALRPVLVQQALHLPLVGKVRPSAVRCWRCVGGARSETVHALLAVPTKLSRKNNATYESTYPYCALVLRAEPLVELSDGVVEGARLVDPVPVVIADVFVGKLLRCDNASVQLRKGPAMRKVTLRQVVHTFLNKHINTQQPDTGRRKIAELKRTSSFSHFFFR